MIGSGNVGGSIGNRLGRCGHQIVFGSRDQENAKIRELASGSGIGSCAVGVPEVAESVDVIILATPWENTKSASISAGTLADKIIVDCTNPLRYTPEKGLELSLG